MARRVITAPIGWPLPIAFAHGDDVRHDALLLEAEEVKWPSLPYPTCTSSAMHRAHRAARTAA